MNTDNLWTAVLAGIMVTAALIGVAQTVYTKPWIGPVREAAVIVTFNGTTDPSQTTAKYLYRSLPWEPAQDAIILYDEDNNMLSHELRVWGLTPASIANGALAWIVAAAAGIALAAETRRHSQ